MQFSTSVTKFMSVKVTVFRCRYK